MPDVVTVEEPDVQRVEHYRRRKATAVLSIMFTDIERSTELREELGEIEFERVREEHDSIVGRIV